MFVPSLFLKKAIWICTLNINVPEGSGVDKLRAVGNDLGAYEVLVVVLLDLGKLVLEDLVKVSSLSCTWNE
jgi:hypothetical protein